VPVLYSGDSTDEVGHHARLMSERSGSQGSIQGSPGLQELHQRRCRPCEGGTTALDSRRTGALLGQVPGWRLSGDRLAIERDFRFSRFEQTIAFVNALAWVAHGQGHHPDIEAAPTRCRVRFTTHAIGGLSENDFICAARVNDLMGSHA
jgi:4a-hydroxytetrahydrobiopterin dehydratase